MTTNGTNQADAVNDPLNPHVIEVSEQGDVVFHLELSSQTSLSAYRSGRIDLCHPSR